MKLALTILSLTATMLHAAIQTESVVYKDGETALEGFVAWDDSVKGARPGVLVVHDWTGLQDYTKERGMCRLRRTFTART